MPPFGLAALHPGLVKLAGDSTTLHNVLLPGAGTGSKTCPSGAMMATSDTVRRFRLPVPVPALAVGVRGRRLRPIHRPWPLIPRTLWAGVAGPHPPIFLVSPPWRASEVERGSGAVKGQTVAVATWTKGGRRAGDAATSA